jgi:hypothetical protein
MQLRTFRNWGIEATKPQQHRIAIGSFRDDMRPASGAEMSEFTG